MVARQGRHRRATRAASIPRGLRLLWPERRWQPGEAAESREPGKHVVPDASAADSAAGTGQPAAQAAASMVTLESVDASDSSRARDENRGGPGPSPASPSVRLVHGDALDVARALVAEGLQANVDLVYLDPPFASESAYRYEARLDGRADGRVVRSLAYDDRWEKDGIGAYLDMLAPRLEAAAGLLSARGTIWVHVDYRASYLVRLLLDEIMGRDAFVNEIVWRRAPNLGRQAASFQFGRTLDTLVVYGGPDASLTPPTRLEPIEPKAIRYDDQGRAFTAAPRGDYTDESIRKLDGEGRVHRTASGKVYVKYFLVPNGEGALCRERRVDALWTDVPPLRHARPEERTGFPTQKPRALLDRILTCASPPGGLVVDLFAGSGTTAESAYALGRRCVTSDASFVSLATARARLLRAGAGLVVQRCGGAHPPEAPAPEVRAEQGDGRTRIELVAPAEPLAWAVTAIEAPFRTAWHSERTLGAKARPAVREAWIPHAPRQLVGLAERRALAVSVWHDDGSVGSCRVELG
jgi:DNA modification methylase